MRLSGVGIGYGRGPLVLSGLDLDLPAGAVVRVAGRNGAGKTTLLRLLAGLTRPSAGRVSDRPATVGFAPERPPAAQPGTAREHLTVALRLRGLAARQVADALDVWGARLGLSPLLDTPLSALSGGSAHKVALVEAVAAVPALVVLDEPFAGLDAASADELPRLVRELADAGSTVVLTDHEQRADGLAGAVWTVRDGGVLQGEVDRPSRVVLRVEVDRSGAADVAARLRAEGHRVDGEP